MWSDRESEIDYLNFGEVSQLAVDIIASPNMLPVSIGIFGNWGAGKSSVLNLIQKQLSEEPDNYIIINFDAWLYQGYDDVRAALLEIIATEINRVVSDNPSLKEKVRNLLDRINMIRLLGLAAEGAALITGIPTGGLLSGLVDPTKQLVQSIQDKDMDDIYEESQQIAEGAKAISNNLIKNSSKGTAPQQINALRKEFEYLLKNINKTLVIVIDNLDRCLPTNAIHTLEAIRLFLFLHKTAFIIAADEEMIRNTVAEYFKGSSNRHQIDYLDKLIQVPIRVPKAGIRTIRAYLFMLFAIEDGLDKDNLERLRCKLEHSLQHSWNEEHISREDALAAINSDDNEQLVNSFELADRIAPILASSPNIHGNPRIVKRLLNVVKMRSKIAKRRKIPLSEAIITKIVIFERCTGAEATTDLYRMIDSEFGKPKLLEDLETQENIDIDKLSLPKSWSQPLTLNFIKAWCKIEPALHHSDLRPAMYLSRETMPIGIYTIGLSPTGRTALQLLLKVNSISSRVGKEQIRLLSIEEQVPVMEGIINHLRQTTEWLSRPDGFVGACLLADFSIEAGILFCNFINNQEDKPPWLVTMVKDYGWYKEQ